MPGGSGRARHPRDNRPMRIVLVTGSDAKAREAGDILGGDVELERADLELPEIQAATVEDVAREKAREAFRRLERACVVEDSGLGFAAWNGLLWPGVVGDECGNWPADLWRPVQHRQYREGSCRTGLPVRVAARCSQRRLERRPHGRDAARWNARFLR